MEDPSLVRLIKERFTRERVVPPLTPDGFFRASSLPYLCTREEVLASRLKRDRLDFVDVDQNINFAQGTGIHWAFQNVVCVDIFGTEYPLSDPESCLLVGQWKCSRCGAVVGGASSEEGNIPRPEFCHGCGDSCHEYQEQLFVDPEMRLTGHNDGFLRFPAFPLGDGVVELKSISTRRAAEVKEAPDLGHAVQLQSYLKLTGCLWGIILYWDKGRYYDPFTEHFLGRDDDTISQIKSELLLMWEGIRTGTLPDRICDASDCPRARKCQLRADCFELKSFAPEYEEMPDA